MTPRSKPYDVVVTVKTDAAIADYIYASIVASSPRVAITRALLLAGREFGDKRVIGAMARL